MSPEGPKSDRQDSAHPTGVRHRASRTWEFTRGVLALVYLLGGIVHLVLGIQSPDLYVEFADQAFISLYTDLWRSFVVPNLSLLQPLVAVFELGVGLALLWRGPALRVGHGAGAAFQLTLVLSGPWGPINAALAVIHLAALRLDYPKSAFAIVRRNVPHEATQ